MSKEDLLGIWYCELVDQEQSDEEAEEVGDYDDFDRPPQKAAKTELATTTLELRADGSFRLEGPEWACSHGSWSDDGGLALSEAEDSSNGFDGLEYAHHRGDRLVVGFKLVPDAHDGLDVLVLTFGRNPPVVKAKPESFVERLIAVEDEDELYELLDDDNFASEPAEVERALWDAWIEGRFLVDPDSEQYSLHLQILEQDTLREASGFTHAHARHGLATVDVDEQRDLAGLLLEKTARLPEDEQADAELAPLLTPAWLERCVWLRYVGGGLPEGFYHRRLVPQPAMDDGSRAYVLRSYYTRFESIERLFPPGHPDFAKAVIRYRGRGLLDLPLAQIDARSLADEALAAALALLGDPAAERSMELWLSGLLFAVVLSVRAKQPLPTIVLDNLAKQRSGMVMGGLSDDEKSRLRELITALPEDQRELVSTRFWLNPK